MIYFAVLLAIAGLCSDSALADTLTMKCSFGGVVPQEIVYVINGEAKDVAIIGGFGTHKGLLLSYTEGFY